MTAFASLWYSGYVIEPADGITRLEAIAITVPVVVFALLFLAVGLLVHRRKPWVRPVVLGVAGLAAVGGGLMLLSFAVAPFTARFLFIDPNPAVGGVLVVSAGVALAWMRRPDVRTWYAG